MLSKKMSLIVTDMKRHLHCSHYFQIPLLLLLSQMGCDDIE